jgi:hypothetical protein
MARQFSGGCLCGGFRYDGLADPILSFSCHCRDCQRATGGTSASAFGVPKEAVKIRGEYRFYPKPSDSGRVVSRGFCPTCGSRAISTVEAFPSIYVIYASSLDDPSWFRPAMDIWVSSALPWDCMDPLVPKHSKGRDSQPPHSEH